MRDVHAERRTDTLEYVQAMLEQLRSMADAERHHMLAYLIEMAAVEVADILKKERVSTFSGEKRNKTA